VKLHLVRHGETEWNKLGRFQGQIDIPLNSRGLAQAKETAQAIAEDGEIALYSSPLQRTMQVADEISHLANVPVVPVPGVKELNLGELEGVTGEEMRNLWPDVYAAWNQDPGTLAMPKGESLSQLQDRAWQALQELEEAHSGDDVIVLVSHNFAIRTMIHKVLGLPLSNFHRLSLGLSSICTVEYTARGRRLSCYNSTGHLSPENR
jgi:broad specificity phosphatase PhoE